MQKKKLSQLEREYKKKYYNFPVSEQIETPLEKFKYYEFEKYMEDTGMTKLYLNLMDSIVDQDVEDEEVAMRLMLQACGQEKGVGEDTGPIKMEIEASEQNIAGAKLRLVEAMLKYMDAIERSTSEDFFIETDERKGTKELTYNRAASLLKQFDCTTKVEHIRRLRKELDIAPPEVTSAQKIQARRKKFMTPSELSFIDAPLEDNPGLGTHLPEEKIFEFSDYGEEELKENTETIGSESSDRH